jgi:hypothetical protein
MRFSVTIGFPSQVLKNVKEEDRKAVWQLLDAVSVNILDSGAEQIANEARSQGCQVRTHSYPGTCYAAGPGQPGTQAPSRELMGSSTLTAEAARQRGLRDGKACIDLRAEAHEMNGEAPFFRGTARKWENGKAVAWNAKPAEETKGLAEAYKIGWRMSQCPRPLWNLWFLNPSQFYKNPGKSPDEWFAVRSVMAYSTIAGAPIDQNEGYLRNRVAEAHAGGLPVNLMPGIGRMGSKGRAIGDHLALERLVKNPPEGLAEISPYLGSQGAWKQLFTGNDQHPSWYQLVKKWRLAGF